MVQKGLNEEEDDTLRALSDDHVIEQRRMGSDENIGTSQELGYKEI
jgi:hypothetical protein